LENVFAMAAVGAFIGMILAITIGVTISHHEHRILDQYDTQAEIRFNDRMEKLDKIEALIIELKNRD